MEHLRSLFLLYVVFTALLKMTHTKVVIFSSEFFRWWKSKNPDWIDIFSSLGTSWGICFPWEFMRLFGFYLWTDKIDTEHLKFIWNVAFALWLIFTKRRSVSLQRLMGLWVCKEVAVADAHCVIEHLWAGADRHSRLAHWVNELTKDEVFGGQNEYYKIYWEVEVSLRQQISWKF